MSQPKGAPGPARIPLRDGTTVEVAGKEIRSLWMEVDPLNLDLVMMLRIGEPPVQYETALTWHEAIAVWREWHR